MAATPGRQAFEAYVWGSSRDVLPWVDQDRKVWEKAAESVKLKPIPVVEDDQPEELHLDAAHASTED